VNANFKAPRDRNVTTSVISVSQNDKIRHFDLIAEIRFLVKSPYLLDYKIIRRGILIADLNAAIHPILCAASLHLQYATRGQKKICRPVYVGGHYHRRSDVPFHRL
jgi:hypothetical protein